MFEINNVYLGDSYELIKKIDDKSIDLIVIDPPYDIKGKKVADESIRKSTNRVARDMYKVNNELIDNEITQGIDEKILDEFMRIMKVPNIYIWCNKNQIPMYFNYFINKHKLNFDILIWNKTNAMPLHNKQYLVDVEYCLYFRGPGMCDPQSYEDAKTVFSSYINVRDKKLFLHPTIKPLEIIETLIRNSSKEGDLVLDCFIGSGTTAVASKNLNRNYIGIEINPKWHKIAVDRLQGINASGQQSLILK